LFIFITHPVTKIPLEEPNDLPIEKVIFFANLVCLFFLLLQVLSKYANPVTADPQGKDLVAAQRQDEVPLSDWELVRGYFGKWHVLLAVLSLTIVLLHICFAPPTLRATLIRWGFDLPDSISELLFSAIVVLQVERVVKMVQQFLQARYWQCK